jgi:mRNA interferase RelE/StbE
VYGVEVLPSAGREMSKLDRAIQRRVARRIDRLASEPRGGGAIKLRGSDDVWRVRVGDHRILYLIEEPRQIVVIVRVAHRREAYR